MLKIHHKITLGTTTFESGKNSRLLKLDVRASLAVPVNASRVVLDVDSKASAKPGDAVKVEIGYDGKLEKVFSGKVSTFEQGLHQIAVEALGTFSKLTAARLNLLYEKQAAGDIASDVLGRLKLQKDKVETGLKFATYVMDDGCTAWEHLHALAGRCGFDFYANPDDKAVFKKYAAQTTHAFEYGAQILSFSFDSLQQMIDGVEIYGESPAGQGQGEDASAWFTKKPVKGTAGKSSGNVLRLADATSRNQNLAGQIATNLMKAYATPARGRMRVLGAPAARLGDAVKTSKMPNASQNGQFKITALRHRLDARTGFVTEIDWEKAT